MQAVLNQLKATEFLSATHIQRLHDTINTNYQTASVEEKALIFAQNVHQVIDHSLIPFDPPHRLAIKRILLPVVVKKQAFSINAYDILKACSELDDMNEATLDTLTHWVNAQQITSLSKEQVCELTTLVTLRPFTPLPIKMSPLTDTYYMPLPHSKICLKRLMEVITSNVHYALLIFCIICFVSALFFRPLYQTQVISTSNCLTPLPIVDVELPICVTLQQKANGLQPQLQFKTINEQALQNWLIRRHSLLADEPYFSEIIETAKDFNINPLLFFAITGQEQGFVPKHHEQAIEIASNPFNVYGSWQEYNTSISDSTRIAARTIINLSQDCPPDTDPIKWLNQKYAEDPHWHKGVSALLEQLEEIATLP